MKIDKWLVVIAGPTAVGKTRLAIDVAKHFRTEIISCDGRQFYRETEIGTAKPDKEELAEVKHHFINTHSIHDDYAAGAFGNDVNQLLPELFKGNNVVVMTGGSGLYIQGVCEGFDDIPESDEGVREQLKKDLNKKGLKTLVQELELKDSEYFQQVDLHNPQRIIRALEVIRTTGKPFSKYLTGGDNIQRDYNIIKIALRMDMEKLYDRINQRMDIMIEQGLFDEAKKLEPYKHLNALQTVGYREIFPYFVGEYDYEEAVRLLKRNSRRYAKRQMTWLRRDQEFNWFEPTQYDEVICFIKSKITGSHV
ncbi:tRNA (adenosine(37)-N6)-dimethylallyltransferase MiaA [Reichenbachiella versicolor]|uniref:tRNA (adenosine(37)-N6)-dimethylallyltransferase MiaA n=1 Tax=Reichenbachiella versicolor TaxID=1821036 RepID=UPI000D6E0752|nr:tRNA (adenosine(37)-N6)-dimethylallyltransferase MiaA [Reichenbachiella versicolor]